MLILAEIFNDSESGYWNHGIFVLRGIMGDYYWYPMYQLENENSEKFDIRCVLEKTDEEICQIEDVEDRFGFTAYGYKFKPGDLQTCNDILKWSRPGTQFLFSESDLENLC